MSFHPQNPQLQYMNLNQQNMIVDQGQFNVPQNFLYPSENIQVPGSVYAANQYAGNQIFSNQAYAPNQMIYQQQPGYGLAQNQNLQTNVFEQQVVIPQPPQTQVVQQVYRIPIRVQGPTQRKVVRSLTPKLMTVNQPPEVRIVNETIRQPVLIQQPPQVRTVYDKVQKQITVPVPPQIQMQRSEVIEPPMIQQPNFIQNQFVSTNPGFQFQNINQNPGFQFQNINQNPGLQLQNINQNPGLQLQNINQNPALQLQNISQNASQFQPYSFVNAGYVNASSAQPNMIVNGLMPQYATTQLLFGNGQMPQMANPLMNQIPNAQFSQFENPQMLQMGPPVQENFPQNVGIQIPQANEPLPPPPASVNITNEMSPPQNPPVENPNPNDLPPESGFFKESQSVAQPSVLLENAPPFKQ